MKKKTDKLWETKGFKAAVIVLAMAVLGNGRGDAFRHLFNRVADAGQPFAQRDIITVQSEQSYQAAIAADYILKTGEIKPHASVLVADKLKATNLRIDWQKTDAFTLAMADLNRRVMLAAANVPAITALRQKPAWTPADQQAWNGEILRLIQRELAHFPMLSLCRSRDDNPALQPAQELNALSDDLNLHRPKHIVNCEQTTAEDACLLQQQADLLLTRAQRPRYYYVTGSAEIDITNNVDDLSDGHNYLVSVQNEQVVDVIETTTDARVPLARPVSFADFLNGELIVSKTGAVYGFDFTHAEADAARVVVGLPSHPAEPKEKRPQFASNNVPRPF